MPTRGPFGITHRFQRLFQSEGYVGYVLLTLSPLYLSEDFRARLACLIHTASVRSEPGSNPSVELIWLCVLGLLRPGPTHRNTRLRHAPGDVQTRSHSNSRVTLFSKIRPQDRRPRPAPLGGLNSPLGRVRVEILVIQWAESRALARKFNLLSTTRAAPPKRLWSETSSG